MMLCNEKYFSVDEVAGMLDMNPVTIRKWVKSGKLKAAQPGGKNYIIKETDLKEFIDSTSTDKKRG